MFLFAYLNPPNEAETCKLLAFLSHQKAGAPDGTSPSQHNGASYGIDEEQIYKSPKVWDKKQIPSNWKRQITVPTIMKGLRTVCGHHGRNRFIQDTLKFWMFVAFSGSSSQTGVKIHRKQVGFRSGQDWVDQLLTPSFQSCSSISLPKIDTHRAPESQSSFDSVGEIDCGIEFSDEEYVKMHILYCNTSWRARP